MDESLLLQIEEASINASASTQQLWMDGWLVRRSPGKAKRARCINAVSEGRLLLDQKLLRAGRLFAEAKLPLLVRLTPFSLPCDLDHQLKRRHFDKLDETRVMALSQLRLMRIESPPLGLRFVALEATRYAEIVGELRSSTVQERLAHATRLTHSPIEYHGFAFVNAEGSVMACGQYAREAELVGLYDVFTRPDQRGHGLAGALCKRLLALAADEAAVCAYLQVDEANVSARGLYTRLGFVDAYTYHYRAAPTSAP